MILLQLFIIFTAFGLATLLVWRYFNKKDQGADSSPEPEPEEKEVAVEPMLESLMDARLAIGVPTETISVLENVCSEWIGLWGLIKKTGKSKDLAIIVDILRIMKVLVPDHIKAFLGSKASDPRKNAELVKFLGVVSDEMARVRSLIESGNEAKYEASKKFMDIRLSDSY